MESGPIILHPTRVPLERGILIIRKGPGGADKRIF